MATRIAFFDTKKYDQISFDLQNKSFNYDITYFEAKLSEKTAALADGYDVVCAFVNDTLNKAVVDILVDKGVKLVAMRCAGYNNVDISASFEKLHVVRVPAYSPYAVAEHAVALLQTLNRKVHRAYARTKEGNFSLGGLVGFDLHGKTAGVIGAGKIGRCLIAILRGYGMNVLAYDPFPDEAYAKETGITFVELDTLYEKSDVISLHSPLMPSTEYMINKEALDKMKDGVVLINTSRGKLIESTALIQALKSGKVGGAGLDVYEEESEYFFEDHSDVILTDDTLARLLSFSNVIITSHQAFLTQEALKNIAEVTLNNIKEYNADGFLENEICYQCDKGCPKKEGKRCF